MVRGTALNHISLHTSMCKLGTVLTRLEPYLGREEWSHPHLNPTFRTSLALESLPCSAQTSSVPQFVGMVVFKSVADQGY